MKVSDAMLCLSVGLFLASRTDQAAAAEEPRQNLRRAQNGNNCNNVIVVLEDDDGEGPFSRRRLNNGANGREIAAENRAKAMAKAKGLGLTADRAYGAALFGFSAKNVCGQKMDEIKADPQVKYVEVDATIQLDPMEMPSEDGRRRLAPGKGQGRPGGGGSDPQEEPWGIARVGGAMDGTDKVVWVVDTGVDCGHEDLNVRCDQNVAFTAFDKGRDAGFDDGNGHGTHVAGTIAAINNGVGVVGVAAGATVIPVKVLNSRGSGSFSGVIDGVDHVAANAAFGDVANMSLGGGFSQAVNDAVIAAAKNGVYMVLAAGNESAHASGSSPASAEHENIYTVSSMAEGDNWSSFSNYGNPPVRFCAPGSHIKSTWKGGGYNTISGTSMAAPHVAGIRAMGAIGSDGTVNGDPDNYADPIAHL